MPLVFCFHFFLFPLEKAFRKLHTLLTVVPLLWTQPPISISLKAKLDSNPNANQLTNKYPAKYMYWEEKNCRNLFSSTYFVEQSKGFTDFSCCFFTFAKKYIQLVIYENKFFSNLALNVKLLTLLVILNSVWKSWKIGHF